MKLAFYFTLTCTARCAHCITFAGPAVKRKMPLEQALAVVSQVAAVPDLTGIVFTGGENLVHHDEMLALVRACGEHGLSSEIITNAYWGRNRDRARELVEAFRDAGLGLFRISVDTYHLPYIQPATVHAAIETLAEAGMTRNLTCVIDRSNIGYKARGLAWLLDRGAIELDGSVDADVLARTLRESWAPDLLALLDTYELDPADCFLVDDLIALQDHGQQTLAEEIAGSRILLQYQFLATEGRGRELLPVTETRPIDELPNLVCDSVGATPTINPEGKLFPCCSSWVNFEDQALGTLEDMDIATFIAGMREDPIAVFMHREGPAALVRHLRESGAELPEGYTHPCHLCGTLLERFPREELLSHIAAYYEQKPWRVLFTSRGFDLALSAYSPLP